MKHRLAAACTAHGNQLLAASAGTIRFGSQYAHSPTRLRLLTQKLLQEELHNTSQFAIQLSRKYEAKRAERDQVIKQLQGQQRYAAVSARLKASLLLALNLTPVF